MHSAALGPSHAWGPKATRSDPAARSLRSASLCPHGSERLPAPTAAQQLLELTQRWTWPLLCAQWGCPSSPPSPLLVLPRQFSVTAGTFSAWISAGSATRGPSFVPWESEDPPNFSILSFTAQSCPAGVCRTQGAAAGGEGAAAPHSSRGLAQTPGLQDSPSPPPPLPATPSPPRDVFNPFGSRWPQPSPAPSRALGKVTGIAAKFVLRSPEAHGISCAHTAPGAHTRTQAPQHAAVHAHTAAFLEKASPPSPSAPHSRAHTQPRTQRSCTHREPRAQPGTHPPLPRTHAPLPAKHPPPPPPTPNLFHTPPKPGSPQGVAPP